MITPTQMGNLALITLRLGFAVLLIFLSMLFLIAG